MFPSRLRPDTATIVGILTAGAVYLIYNNALPSTTDIRESAADNPSVEFERKKAAWVSTGLIASVFIVSRDINSYIISGIALIGIDYMHKHANAIHPHTQSTVPVTSAESIAPVAAADYALPEYTGDYESVG